MKMPHNKANFGIGALAINILPVSFDADIRKRASRQGMRRSESGNWRGDCLDSPARRRYGPARF
jgi:hypothetical protein